MHYFFFLTRMLALTALLSHSRASRVLPGLRSFYRGGSSGTLDRAAAARAGAAFVRGGWVSSSGPASAAVKGSRARGGMGSSRRHSLSEAGMKSDSTHTADTRKEQSGNACEDDDEDSKNEEFCERDWIIAAQGLISKGGAAQDKEAKAGADNGPLLLRGLSADMRECLRRFHLPVFRWIKELRERQQQQEEEEEDEGAGGKRGGGDHRPLLVGISAPQGCGKTTLCGILTELLKSHGLRCCALSLDDFYLTGAQQDSLAAASSGNALLQSRGNAGTHDLPLAMATLSALQGLGGGQRAKLPRYSKHLRGGKGDRATEEEWTEVEGPLDIILLEGWMLGFEALDGVALEDALDRAAAAARVTVGDTAPGEAGGKGACPAQQEEEEVEEAPPESEGSVALRTALTRVNTELRAYGPLHDEVQAWLVVKVSDISSVYTWRAEAEASMRASGKGGMSEAEVRAFVGRFMPAYSAYLPRLYTLGPQGQQQQQQQQLEEEEAEEGGCSRSKLSKSLALVEVDRARKPTEEGLVVQL